MLGRLGQSYGEGAREEVSRRSGSGSGVGFGSGGGEGERVGEVEARAEPAESDGEVEGFGTLRPAAAERFQIGELEDVPHQSSGEEADDENEDGEWDPLECQHAFAATR